MNVETTFDRPYLATSLGVVPADFVADLSAAAYGVALRYAADTDWLDLQLDLWHALTDAANAWKLETNRPAR